MNEYISKSNGSRSSAHDFLAEHHFLQQEVERLRKENTELKVQRDVYANTCAEQQEKLTIAEDALFTTKRYVTAMRTRLKTVVEITLAADREANEFALQEPMPAVRKGERMTEAQVDEVIRQTTSTGVSVGHATNLPANRLDES